MGAVCALCSLLLRYALTPYLGGEEKFVAIFPALLLASLWGDLLGGAACLAIALVAGWWLFIGEPRSFAFAPHEAAGLIALLISGAAVVAGSVAMRRLIVRLEAAHEGQRVLALELQHRVKNNLAVVEALATQSLRSADDLQGFSHAFFGRLRSLAVAHTLLSQGAENRAAVGEVVTRTLAPFDGGGRIVRRGEPASLSSEQAVALTLCLHELATNAVKHGVLAGRGGMVELTWKRLGGDLFQVRWIEHGAPVEPPSRQGFGTRLLRRGIEPSRPAQLDYGPEGVSWTAQFRLPAELRTPRRALAIRRSRASPNASQPAS